MERRKDSKGRVLEKGEVQRKDGSYMFRYTDSRGKRCAIYDRDLSSLREAARKIRRNIEDDIDVSDRTLNEQFEKFFQLNCHNSVNTNLRYTTTWRNHIRDTALGHKRLCDIRRSDGRQFLNDLLDKGLKNSTVRMHYELVRQCLQSAVDDDIIRTNPFDAKIPISKNVAEKTALTDGQIDTLMSFMKQSAYFKRYAPMLTLFLETGVRCGELCGLTWDDVDFENKCLHIDHQLLYSRFDDGFRFYIRKPKTKAGIRVIPLTSKALKALTEQRAWQFRNGFRSDVEIDGYTNFVFTTKNCKPYNHPSIDRTIRLMAKRIREQTDAKDFPTFSAHILRHTACSRMVRARMDLKAVQRVLGHSDISITLNVYTHITEDQIVEEMSKLEDSTASNF